MCKYTHIYIYSQSLYFIYIYIYIYVYIYIERERLSTSSFCCSVRFHFCISQVFFSAWLRVLFYFYSRWNLNIKEWLFKKKFKKFLTIWMVDLKGSCSGHALLASRDLRCIYIYIYIYIYQLLKNTGIYTQRFKYKSIAKIHIRIGYKILRVIKIVSLNVTKWGLFFNIVTFADGL